MTAGRHPVTVSASATKLLVLENPRPSRKPTDVNPNPLTTEAANDVWATKRVPGQQRIRKSRAAAGWCGGRPI